MPIARSGRDAYHKLLYMLRTYLALGRSSPTCLPPPFSLHIVQSRHWFTSYSSCHLLWEGIQVLDALIQLSIKYWRSEYQSKPEAPGFKENERLNGHTLRPSSTGLFHTRKTKKFVDKTLMPQSPRMHGVTHSGPSYDMTWLDHQASKWASRKIGHIAIWIHSTVCGRAWFFVTVLVVPALHLSSRPPTGFSIKDLHT